MGKPSRRTFYKRLVIPLCLVFTVVVFDRMDQEFVVPGQLKKIIDILDIQTEKEDDWWRARIKIRHRGFDKVKIPGVPVIAIPTTAGTGSEVTFNAVFTNKQEQKKQAPLHTPFIPPLRLDKIINQLIITL